MPTLMPSIFTRIISGEIPGRFVFKDDLWVALLDISPANPGHVLLIPQHEAQYLSDLPVATLAVLGDRLGRLIATVKRATGAPAVNVIVNDGPAANQAVPHVHLHLIPRFPGDGKLVHPKGTPYGDGELERWAEALRSAWR
jgi:histidine triad (HIT) family protein